MPTHENVPKRESNQAILAHVKEEADESPINFYVRVNAARGRIMAKLTTATRDRISATKFAFPKQRKEPLENAAHVRNAAARFNQLKGVTEAERRAAWKRIESAAKQFGVELDKAA
jgi:hypothetical protein